MSERRCPKCGSVYTDTARFCPKDGTMLVEVQAKPASSGSGTGVRQPPNSGKGPGLDRASTLSNQILDARYQVLKKLGEGGMSYVYLAQLLHRRAPAAQLREGAGPGPRLDALEPDPGRPLPGVEEAG